MVLDNRAERVTIASMATTTTLGLIEIIVGTLFGSIAFVAAGTDALADTVTSVGVFTGLRVSKKPADKGHPYGHSQSETIASFILAIVLLVAGANIAYQAIQRVVQGSALTIGWEMVVTACLAISVLLLLAYSKISAGKKTGHFSVVTDGYHTLSDSISAAGVLIGFAAVSLGYPIADPIVGVIISIIVLRWGVITAKNSVQVLMEASPGNEVVRKIKRECRNVEGIIDCHECRARRVGSKIFADLHVLVDPELSVEESHKIATRVERHLKKEVNGLDSILVHVEPYKGKKLENSRKN
jgi:cation diffusion facilitator family transporter